MTMEMKRPERKFQDVKVSEEDIVLFTLGIDKNEFILPSKRDSYLTDLRAVSLLEDIKAGKDVSNKDFTGINLKGADLSGANLKGCNFSKSCFYQTKAKDCNFEGAKFDDAFVEECDFAKSCFKDVSFKRTFMRNNNLKDAVLDEDAEKYITDFDKFLELVESGKIDLRSLTKKDLLSVDIRRLDLTKVDLKGIDLSQFALDGINLAGTYIDPKQLLSLGGLQKYYFDLRKTKEKKKKQMEEAVLKEYEEKLLNYAQKAQQLEEEIVLKNIKKPAKKEVSPNSYRAWPAALNEKENNEIEDEVKVKHKGKMEVDDTPSFIKKSTFDGGENSSYISNDSTFIGEETSVKRVATKARKVEKVKFKTKG